MVTEDQECALRGAITWAINDDSEGVRCALKTEFNEEEARKLEDKLYNEDIMEPVLEAFEKAFQKLKA